VLKIARTKTKQILYSALAIETLYPRMTDNHVPAISTIFSLRRPVVANTYYIYGMQQFLYWRMQVLLLYGGHQKVEDVVGDGTKVLLTIEQQALGACVELFQGHVSLLASRSTAGIWAVTFVPF
jgi:hypothetical protein